MSETKKYTKAAEKLAAELKATVTREDFRLLESHVCAALTEFCRQSEAFGGRGSGVGEEAFRLHRVARILGCALSRCARSVPPCGEVLSALGGG